MGTLVSCVSEMLYAGEKLSLYFVCTCVIFCFVITFVMTLGFGIGLGYNYCFVDMKTKFKYVEGRYVYPGKPPYDVVSAERSGGMQDPDYDTRSEEDNLRRLVTVPDSLTRASPLVVPGSPSQEMLKHYLFNTDNTTAVAVFSDSISVNGTESSLKANKEAATTKLSEITTQTNRRACTSLPIRTSPITNFPDTENIYDIDEPTKGPSIDNDIDEPTPEPSIVNELDEPTLEPTNAFGADESDPESSINNDPSKRKMKKLVIPISGLDLINVLSKLRAENKNYSLQIVTT